ncbi:hypothetical protein Pcinc_041598 [Petrolisthes cinctipes]|uniref:HTH CENPB-type domain-containing protein n=1 Tax=Petrolisthes cinctipes TaxID=88211 RepID=A0AAE1BKF7_PETCI|nr:hypothetical protein Pcinc_041598 [Petrolisthes cinctipes]
MAYDHTYGQTARRHARKTMAKPRNEELDQACLKWFWQLRGTGVFVRTTELKAAAEKFARHLNIPDFKASEGWVTRFKVRHGLSNKKTHGESLDAATENIDQFRDKLRRLIDCEGLSLNQVYNADETGLYFRSIPTNTLADEKEKCVPGRKLSKTRVSALCGANATGSHRLQPVVVGTAKNPRCLRGLMDRLPVIYYPSLKAWFNTRIFSDWFFNHAVKEIVRSRPLCSSITLQLTLVSVS